MIPFPKIILINLFLFTLPFNSNCSDNPKSLKKNIAGWKIPENEIDSTKLLIQSIEGTYEIKKYWEIYAGGTDTSTYTIIFDQNSLTKYWNNLNTRIDLTKPDVDFRKNILVVAQPGVGMTKFKYRLNISKNIKSIDIVISNYPSMSLNAPPISIYPIFALELSRPPNSEQIKVIFDIDSRSKGMQPK
ncbi:MAG: hypothetical protein JXB48_10995 [Candidatus Latescibacteria bacterium]|nr:hypothetical protein [Candidatus Latescibacterota bacterium]